MNTYEQKAFRFSSEPVHQRLYDFHTFMMHDFPLLLGELSLTPGEPKGFVRYYLTDTIYTVNWADTQYQTVIQAYMDFGRIQTRVHMPILNVGQKPSLITAIDPILRRTEILLESHTPTTHIEIPYLGQQFDGMISALVKRTYRERETFEPLIHDVVFLLTSRQKIHATIQEATQYFFPS